MLNVHVCMRVIEVCEASIETQCPEARDNLNNITSQSCWVSMVNEESTSDNWMRTDSETVEADENILGAHLQTKY
jgi:hypothetical protein